ncbi:serine/threonine-protein phosphatase [Ruegeria sp. SCSIO 43209]|uniref:PP2C family protein-serine/threonine phosphatase n=1 Tax=Ruegeria sp. SCSIO 43209 TaxID=2793010 RepID=UPI001CAA2204|nr:protein phosphatase 2C domain-containing protein [Ruegeria sp. SCSIO 43209]UAB88706.1 serine/threonine-protein phosphatase [Ruegeria sp. SCSIO 43209]
MRTAWIATHTGVVRSRNEDNCCAGTWAADGGDGAWTVDLRGNRWIAAVADGMGGHQAGEIASEITISELIKMADQIEGKTSASEILERVNRKVFQAMFAPLGRPGMGSTIVGIAFRDEVGLFFNLGDSRAYIVRDTDLVQTSTDHTIGMGGDHRTRSHRLTQSLGGTTHRAPIFPHVQSERLAPGDRILLCSDGLTDMIGSEEILKILSQNRTHPAQALVSAALNSGGYDNVTVIVIGKLQKC